MSSTAAEVLARMAEFDHSIRPRIVNQMATFGMAVVHMTLNHKTPCIKYGRCKRRSRRVFPLGAKLLPPVEFLI